MNQAVSDQVEPLAIQHFLFFYKKMREGDPTPSREFYTTSGGRHQDTNKKVAEHPQPWL